MKTEVAIRLPDKKEMAEVLTEHMVQLEFNYDQTGIDGITRQQLEDVADIIIGGERHTRCRVVEAYLERGHAIKKALSLWTPAAELNAFEWLLDRCGVTKRQASDAIAVFNLFNDRNETAVSKFAPTTLVFLSKYAAHKRFITNALQLAESSDREIPLSVVKEWVSDNGEPREEIGFSVSAPKTIADATAWVVKKVKSAMKRWPDDLKHDVGDILRAAAQEMNGHDDIEDSPDDEED